MKKLKPLIVTILNSLLTFLVTLPAWSSMYIDDKPVQTVMIALAGAVIGTILATRINLEKYAVVKLLTAGVLFVFCVLSYSYIMDNALSDSFKNLFMLFLLLFAVFCIGCYLLTYLELFVIDRIK